MASGKTQLQYAYTDAPELHQHLLLSSLQLLFWIFFHPSAWAHHLARISPALHAHVTLAELSPTQYRHPALRRLLLQFFIIWPFWLALAIGLGLWLVGLREMLLTSVVVAVSSYLVISGLMGTALALNIAAIGGLLAGSVAGIGTSLFQLTLGTTASGYFKFISHWPASSEEPFLWLGAVIGIITGFFGSFVSRLTTPRERQVLKIQTGIIGFLACAITFVCAFYVVWGGNARVMPLNLAVIVGFACIFGLATSWRIGHLRRSMMLHIFFASLFGGIFLLAVRGSGPLASGMAYGIYAGSLSCFFFIWPYVLVEKIAGPKIAAMVVTVGSGSGGAALYAQFVDSWWLMFVVGVVGTLIGFTFSWWRSILFYPLEVVWSLLLFKAERQSLHYLRWHSAFWDEFQWLPLFRLEKHLVLVAERDPHEAQMAIEYLSTSRQRWAAVAAQIELDARHLDSCKDVEAISYASRHLAAGELEGPASALLRSLSRISQDLLAVQKQASRHHQRLALRAVEERLDALLGELTRSGERYAQRFEPITARWRQLVAEHVQQITRAAEQQRDIKNPYMFGVPLREQDTLFVGREKMAKRIEQLLDTSHPVPLLLYGQRRMGKTSLLHHLARLLPTRIVPLFIDGERLSGANGYPDFLYQLARELVKSAKRTRQLILPHLTREKLISHPQSTFHEWLDQVEALIENSPYGRLLLMLDEFEALLSVSHAQNINSNEFWLMIRHLIQHRPHFNVLLSGSHTLDNYKQWASYLINVQVIKLSYLTEEESRRLIESPIPNFPLRYSPNASQRIYELTRGYPHLIQLLCYELIELKNRQPFAQRHLATLANVEAAISRTFERGRFFFTDIEKHQLSSHDVTLLRYLATQGEQAIVARERLACHVPDKLDEHLRALCQRDLIESVAGGGVRFQVELIRRWFVAATAIGT